jgi:ABC-type phosphate/phosphonate transport system ATPase subunit
MTAPGDIVLQAEGVTKTFPGVKALDDVSITLRSGRLTALLGENGAGKSTLMNVIAGVFPADCGDKIGSIPFVNFRFNGATLFRRNGSSKMRYKSDFGQGFQLPIFSFFSGLFFGCSLTI